MIAMNRWPAAAATVIAAFCFVATATDGVAAEPKDKSPASIQEVVAGKVTRIKGSAIAIQNAQPRILGVGADIRLGDIISTGPESRLEMRMRDDAIFTLGARTNFVVMEYEFKDDVGGSAMRLMSGAVNIVTGKIAQLASATNRIETEFATISIRGTALWLGTITEDFEVVMWKGKGVFVTNRAGDAEITKPNNGVLISGPDEEPDPPVDWAPDKICAARATVEF